MPRVVSIEIMETDDPIDVFDIQVEHDHSFVVHGAVLHNSTICKARSRLMWDLDGNPIGHDMVLIGPPAHYNCRSVLIPVLKPWREVSTEVTDVVNAKFPKSQADEKIEALQASMGGPVSADLNYEEWLRTQTVEFQLEVLGPTKHRLWQDGKITFRDLVDQRGNPLTLAEIIAKVESGQTTTARGETMRKAKEAAATVEDLEKKAAAAEKDARNQVNRSVKAGYVTEDERDALREYREDRVAGKEPELPAVEAFDARPEWLRDRITAAIEARRIALKAAQQAGPAAEYAKRKAVAESAQRLKTTLHDPDSIAEWLPGQITDAELNDVPFQPWVLPNHYNWTRAPGRKPDLPEPPMPQVTGKRTAAAVVMVEEDGRAWVYQQSGDSGDQEPTHAVPSGALESGMDAQAIAVREAWEATGLRAEILAHLSDYERPASVTRYYVARRTGGAPWRMGHEAQAVKLVPLDQLPAIAADDVDKAVAHDLAAMFRKAMTAGEGILAKGMSIIAGIAVQLALAAAKRKAALLKEWVSQTAKGQQPSAAASAAYAALSADEKAAYAALAAAKAKT